MKKNVSVLMFRFTSPSSNQLNGIRSAVQTDGARNVIATVVKGSVARCPFEMHLEQVL